MMNPTRRNFLARTIGLLAAGIGAPAAIASLAAKPRRVRSRVTPAPTLDILAPKLVGENQWRLEAVKATYIHDGQYYIVDYDVVIDNGPRQSGCVLAHGLR